MAKKKKKSPKRRRRKVKKKTSKRKKVIRKKIKSRKKSIKLNEKDGTFDLTMQKDFAFSGLGENFTLTKIAKKTLSDDDGNYELCRYSKEDFLKLNLVQVKFMLMW